jgi:hypothetical protein
MFFSTTAEAKLNWYSGAVCNSIYVTISLNKIKEYFHKTMSQVHICRMQCSLHLCANLQYCMASYYYTINFCTPYIMCALMMAYFIFPFLMKHKNEETDNNISNKKPWK